MITKSEAFKRKITIVTILVMIVGLFSGRAILSVAMIGFIIISLWQINSLDISGLYKNHHWLCFLGLLFILPLISGLWSDNTSRWLGIMQIKIPLLLLPVCSIVFSRFNSRIFSAVNLTFVGLMLIACCWSCWQYFSDISGINENYLRAKVIPTLMSNDHVRFSWAVLIACILLFYELRSHHHSINKTSKIIGVSVLVFFAVFIHLLSAKTGLIGIYVISLFMSFYLLRKKKKLLFSSLLVIISIPLMAYVALPTFRNRVKFVWWDFQNYSRGNYVEGLSDAPRVLSIQAGWDILQNQPFHGTGFGDLHQEMQRWYATHADYLKEYERQMPSNEMLLYAAGAGVPAGIIFLLVTLMPFTLKRLRNNLYWIAFHLLACLGFFFEIYLEVQYGIFLYTFFAVWFYWILVNNPKQKNN